MGKAKPEGTDNAAPSNALVKDIQNSLGIDLGDIVKDVAKDYAKDSLFGSKTKNTSKTKFSKALDAVSDFVRSVWWVPALAYMVLGISIISIKFLGKLVGV
jgi:hypothetical protein